MNSYEEIYCRPEKTPLSREIEFYEKLAENAKKDPYEKQDINIRRPCIKKMQRRTAPKKLALILNSII